jgi:hypothetical protein
LCRGKVVFGIYVGETSFRGNVVGGIDVVPSNRPRDNTDLRGQPLIDRRPLQLDTVFKLSLVIRVTRSGEFSPIGHYLLWATFFLFLCLYGDQWCRSPQVLATDR